MKIVKADGKDISDTDGPVAPINMIGKTLFRQVKVTVNGRLAYDSGPNYAYRAILETECNIDNNLKDSFMHCQMYFKDVPHDKINTEDNVGFKNRSSFFKRSAEAQVIAPVICDLFQSDRLMLANTQIGLELHKNSNDFCLQCFKVGTALAPVVKFRLVMTDMVWFVKTVCVSPSQHLAIEAVLRRQPARYPIRRVDVTRLTVPPNRQSIPTTPIANGQIPRRVLLTFVETDAYYGDFKKSPFLFQNYGLSEICIEAGGRLYPREKLVLDYKKRHFARAFVQLYETLGLDDSRIGNSISYNDFLHTHCIYAFDLCPDEPDSTQWNLIRTGATIIRGQFAEAVKEPGLEAILYLEYDSLIMIDHLRNVHSDYSI